MIVSAILQAYEAKAVPEGKHYPLPLAPNRVPWWRVNRWLCAYYPGWREWQKNKDMSEIISYFEASL